MSRRFTFVMATRNRADYLERVLVNVRQYVGPDDEFILVDGASTDGTLEVIARNRDVITDYISEKDTSEPHALNKGILRARGRYIKLLTDDDHTFPGAIERAAAVLAAHPEIDALQCGGEHFRRSPEGAEEFKYHAWFPPGAAWKDDVWNAIRYKVACGLGLFFAPRIVAQVGLLDTSYAAMDTEFILRLLAHRIDYRFLSVMLYRHITYPHSIIANQERARRDRIRLVLRLLTWDPAAPQHFPLKELASRLGMSDLDLEKLLFFLRREARRDDRSWQRVAKPVLSGGKAMWELLERVRDSAEPELERPVPVWDGSLR